MPVDIDIHHTIPEYHITPTRLKNRVQWLLKQLGAGDRTVSIVFVDDTEMEWFNTNYRNKPETTNVLSFPLFSGEEESLAAVPISELGDIIISLDRALEEAIEHAETIEHRVNWLLIHGLLHLLGYDHERSEGEAEEMYAIEQDLLRRLDHHRRQMMTHLAINVDHVATIRQARGINEPDPVTAAAICELAGAAGIVVHLREDRRHIQDRDVLLLRETVKTKLNLEMGATKEMVQIALDLVPDLVTLVPEKREELTTEGGLDVVTQKKKLSKAIKKLADKNIPVSLFVDPDPEQIKASLDVGATFVEIHTGRYCDATSEEEIEEEFQLISDSASLAFQMGLRVNAGHGLNYTNTARIAALDTIEELSIGHAIISRAVFVGMDQAVREMKTIIDQAQLSI